VREEIDWCKVSKMLVISCKNSNVRLNLPMAYDAKNCSEF
jgi:hypothetical protein